MADEHDRKKYGAQQETPAEREAKKNPANQQNLERPAEGRDEAPAKSIEKGKRSSKSPWMGGG
jgi:hypothetical protein